MGKKGTKTGKNLGGRAVEPNDWTRGKRGGEKGRQKGKKNHRKAERGVAEEK